MKRFRSIVTVLLIASASAALQAQERTVAAAKVPFSFNAENITLPAGIYTVSTLPPYNMIKVTSADGRQVATIPAQPAITSTEASQTKLVFTLVGGQYFLTEVWEKDSVMHRDVRIGRRAQELAKTNRTNRQLVTVLGGAPGKTAFPSGK